MRKFLLVTALLAGTFLPASAQNDTNDWNRVDTVQVNRIDAERRMSFEEKTNYRPKTFFVELGGPSLNFGFNFDTRFMRRYNGLGMRVGVSYASFAGLQSLFTLPVQINYLLGKRGKYFEMGAGATLALASESYNDEKAVHSKIFGTMMFGYRKQPVKGGFTYGVGFAPVYGTIEGKFFFMPYLPYVSFGYSF